MALELLQLEVGRYGIQTRAIKMILGLLIGFALGIAFALISSGFTRGLQLYWQFKADGRLVGLDEAEQLASDGARVFVIRDQKAYRILLLPKGEENVSQMSPHEICFKAMMLDKFWGAHGFWKKRFPETEAEPLSLMHFG